jgi:hypothetical protein
VKGLDDRNIELEFFVSDPLHGGFSAAEVLDEFEELGLRHLDLSAAGLRHESVTKMTYKLRRETGKILTGI